MDTRIETRGVHMTIDEILAPYHRRFEKTGNPIYVWEAFHVCRGDRRPPWPLPDWVIGYFDKVADRLLELRRVGASSGRRVPRGKGKPKPKPKRSNVWMREVVVALQFETGARGGGSNNPFDGGNIAEKYIGMIDEVQRLMGQGLSQEKAVNDVAIANGINERTLKRKLAGYRGLGWN